MTDKPIIELTNQIAQETMRYPFKVWGFGEGVALEALWEASDHLNESLYREFVLNLFERWVSRPIEEPDHSAPSMLLLMAYEHTRDMRYLEVAKSLAGHMHQLPQATNGARFHRPQHADYHHYIYVDCMEVDAPFLCKLAQVTGNADFYDAGATQILSYCALLQDQSTGLFYHQYNGETNTINGAFWGRGNGWALLGLLKTLLILPSTHANYQQIKSNYQQLAQALISLQHANGAWSTVLDQPETYQESSLPAMFGTGILSGIQNGLLPETYQLHVDRAKQNMLEHIADGVLHGVSIATPPGSASHYNSIQTASGFPWGQGPALQFLMQHI